MVRPRDRIDRLPASMQAARTIGGVIMNRVISVPLGLRRDGDLRYDAIGHGLIKVGHGFDLPRSGYATYIVRPCVKAQAII
jgi:hypothetical protein